MCQLQRLLYELSSLPVYLMWQEWRFYFPSAVRRRFHVNHSGIAALQWKLPQPSILPIAKRWPTFLGIKITYDRNVGTMHWKAAVKVWHGRLQLFEDTVSFWEVCGYVLPGWLLESIPTATCSATLDRTEANSAPPWRVEECGAGTADAWQTTVATSSNVAEYVAISAAAREAKNWLKVDWYVKKDL